MVILINYIMITMKQYLVINVLMKAIPNAHLTRPGEDTIWMGGTSPSLLPFTDLYFPLQRLKPQPLAAFLLWVKTFSYYIKITKTLVLEHSVRSLTSPSPRQKLIT